MSKLSAHSAIVAITKQTGREKRLKIEAGLWAVTRSSVQNVITKGERHKSAFKQTYALHLLKNTQIKIKEFSMKNIHKININFQLNFLAYIFAILWILFLLAFGGKF